MSAFVILLKVFGNFVGNQRGRNFGVVGGVCAIDLFPVHVAAEIDFGVVARRDVVVIPLF